MLRLSQPHMFNVGHVCEKFYSNASFVQHIYQNDSPFLKKFIYVVHVNEKMKKTKRDRNTVFMKGSWCFNLPPTSAILDHGHMQYLVYSGSCLDMNQQPSCVGLPAEPLSSPDQLFSVLWYRVGTHSFFEYLNICFHS